MIDDFKITISERIGALDQKAKSAHARIDTVEEEVKSMLKEVSAQLVILNAHMNRQKGFGAAILMLGGVLGFLLERVFK